MERQKIGDAGAALRPAVDEIKLAVVVPERTRINQPLARLDELRRRPFAGGIRGGGKINSKIGVGIKNPELAVVPTNRRRPDAFAMAHHGKMIRRRLNGENMGDDRPVDEILRVQDRQARHGVKTRRHQIKIIADADGIRVRVIGEQHGVLIGAVAAIRNPRRDGRRRRSHNRGVKFPGNNLARPVEYRPSLVRSRPHHYSTGQVGERAQLQNRPRELQRARFGTMNAENPSAKTGEQDGGDDCARFHKIITARFSGQLQHVKVLRVYPDGIGEVEITAGIKLVRHQPRPVENRRGKVR